MFEAFLLLATAAAFFGVWRTWRDPRNWRFDPQQEIVFNHWKELWLASLVALTLAGVTVFMLV